MPQSSPTPQNLAPSRWLLFLFPWLEGVRDNPLYLRLSRKRFVRRRNIFNTPQELRAGDGWREALSILLSVLALSLFAIVGCCFWPLTLPASLLQLFSLSCVLQIQNFAANFERDELRSSLWPTLLSRDDYARALCAAVLELHGRLCLSGTLLSAAFISALLGSFALIGLIGSSVDYALEMAKWALICSFAFAALALDLIANSVLAVVVASKRLGERAPSAYSCALVSIEAAASSSLLALPAMLAYMVARADLFGSPVAFLFLLASTPIRVALVVLFARSALPDSLCELGRRLAKSAETR